MARKAKKLAQTTSVGSAAKYTPANKNHTMYGFTVTVHAFVDGLVTVSFLDGTHYHALPKELTAS